MIKPAGPPYRILSLSLCGFRILSHGVVGSYGPRACVKTHTWWQQMLWVERVPGRCHLSPHCRGILEEQDQEGISTPRHHQSIPVSIPSNQQLHYSNSTKVWEQFKYKGVWMRDLRINSSGYLWGPQNQKLPPHHHLSSPFSGKIVFLSHKIHWE